MEINNKLIERIENILIENDVLTVNDYIDFIIALILDNFTINDTIKLIEKIEKMEVKNWIK